MPKFLWQTSEQVVKTALRDLDRNHAVSVPGIQNKGAAFLVRVTPRGMVRRMSAGVGRRLRD